MKTTTTPMFLFHGFMTGMQGGVFGLSADEFNQYGGDVGAAEQLRVWADRLDAVWERIKEHGVTGSWDFSVVGTFGVYLRRNGLYVGRTSYEYDATVSWLIDLVMENVAIDDETRLAMLPHVLRETINNVKEE